MILLICEGDGPQKPDSERIKMVKISKESLVTLVELPPTQYGILNGDISFDIYSKSRMPARAIHVLEGILKYDGWSNTKSINPVFNERKGKLSVENLKRIFNSDILLISSITRTSPQSQELARLYKLNNPNGRVIVGGPDPTFRLEDWLKYADIVVMKEGERTISKLMNRLIGDPKNLEDIDGLAFKKGKDIVVTNERRLLTSEELSNLPHPFYDKDIRSKISTGVVETSRGCPNKCDFCTVTKIYGRKYRVKSPGYVIEELKQTRDIGKYLFYSDDNLIAVPNKTMKLLEAIVENNLNKKYGVAQTTIELANMPELMQALKNAKITALCVGIESINDETLKYLGKPYTAKQIKEAIKTLKEAGFWIHGMMMPGGDGDTPETLRETLEWAYRNLDSVQWFPPTPLPGSDLYDLLESEGRILTKNWSLYDAQHVVFRPEHFSPYELQRTIHEMYDDFYSVRGTIRRLKHSPNKKLSLELLAYAKLTGMKMLYNPQSNQHLEFLRSVS